MLTSEMSQQCTAEIGKNPDNNSARISSFSRNENRAIHERCSREMFSR